MNLYSAFLTHETGSVEFIGTFETRGEALSVGRCFKGMKSTLSVLPHKLGTSAPILMSRITNVCCVVD